MAAPDRRRRSHSGQMPRLPGLGRDPRAPGGAVLGDAIDGVRALTGAIIGAAFCAPAEALTTARRGAAEIKPLWQRILGQRAADGGLRLAARPRLRRRAAAAHRDPLRRAAGRARPAPAQAALGLAVGVAVGALFAALDTGRGPALVAAAVTSPTARSRPSPIAAAARADDGRGGAGRRSCATSCPSRRARATSAPTTSSSSRRFAVAPSPATRPTWGSSPPSTTSTARPSTPRRVHPLIREFYEHTSRFKLSIVPEWRPG